MALFYQQNINESTCLAIWKIEEPEDFFLQRVTLQREITHPNKRLQHLAGRYLLPFLFPDFPDADIEIANTRSLFYRWNSIIFPSPTAAILQRHWLAKTEEWVLI